MGCILVKILDPAPPDASIRAFWHIDGFIVDAVDPLTVNTKSPRKASPEGLEVSRAATASTPLTKTQSDSHISSFAKLGAVQSRPAGVLYVYNGRLIYRSRRCPFFSRQKPNPLQIDIRAIENVNWYFYYSYPQWWIFASVWFQDCKSYSGQVVDIIVSSPTSSQPFHVGFFTREAEEVSRMLSETCVRHRQKPKIFQFNSVDVDGVEIELP